MRITIDRDRALLSPDDAMGHYNAMLDQANLPPDRQAQMSAAIGRVIHEQPNLLDAYDVSVEYTGDDIRVWIIPNKDLRKRTRRP